MEQSEERLKVIARINEYEKAGRFNDDVEDDPPTTVIRPNDVDYVNKKLSSKFLTRLANFLGRTFFESMIKKNKFIIKEITGLDNAAAVKQGAIVTCNHFNIRDNYAVYRALIPVFKKRQYLYKVIKEGNYTNFKGPIRLMMRHANTLPLSSDFETMKKFYAGVKTLLNRGEKILIYPEQAMWFNYRKPRPMQIGAFRLAARNNAPVLPAFICMKDSEFSDDDGFPVQEYYIHFFPAIYPDENLSEKENAEKMREKNHELWVNRYEEFYNEKLTF
ncbi:MAG: lysophospholipid acyltransferase family protein [Christensenellaceae bacterium]